jgi:exopolysaccharide biosynthesis polyprenyl glycosylphosphotransferase
MRFQESQFVELISCIPEASGDALREASPTPSFAFWPGGQRLDHSWWVHAAFDCVALVVAWIVSLKIFEVLFQEQPPALNTVAHLALITEFMGTLFLWTLVSSWSRAHRSVSPGSFRSAMSTVIAPAIAVSGAMMLAITVMEQRLPSTATMLILMFASTSAALLISAHYLAGAVGCFMSSKWLFNGRIALVGDPEACEVLTKCIQQTAGGRARILGIVLPDSCNAYALDRGANVLGMRRELAAIINREKIQRIILAGEGIAPREIDDTFQVSSRMGVTASYSVISRAPDGRSICAHDYGLQLLSERGVSRWLRDSFPKRAIDILAALLLLALFAPVMIALAVLIKLTSAGPVFYKSRRVGVGGRYFVCWKFRSMHHASRREQVESGNEQDGHIFKIREDPRVTSVGRQLRRYSLDELPQLFNVLRGEMSIVGPRPLPAEDLDPDGFSARFRHWAEERARVRPGITGLWQTSGRSNVSFEQMMKLDIQYVEQLSPFLDLRIMLATPAVMWSGRGAY